MENRFHGCDVLVDIQNHKEIFIYESKNTWFMEVVEEKNFAGDHDMDITSTKILYCPYCGRLLK